MKEWENRDLLLYDLPFVPFSTICWKNISRSTHLCNKTFSATAQGKDVEKSKKKVLVLLTYKYQKKIEETVHGWNCNASLCTSSLPYHSHFLYPGHRLKSTSENRHHQRCCREGEWVCVVCYSAVVVFTPHLAQQHPPHFSDALRISLPFQSFLSWLQFCVPPGSALLADYVNTYKDLWLTYVSHN